MGIGATTGPIAGVGLAIGYAYQSTAWPITGVGVTVMSIAGVGATARTAVKLEEFLGQLYPQSERTC